MNELVSYVLREQERDARPGRDLPPSKVPLLLEDLVRVLRVLANVTRGRLATMTRRAGKQLAGGEEGVAIAFLETREARRYRMATPIITEHVTYPSASAFLFFVQTLLFISLRHLIHDLVDRPSTRTDAPWILLSTRSGFEGLVVRAWRFWLRRLWWFGAVILPGWLVLDCAGWPKGAWQLVLLVGLFALIP
ncbi:MAG: hypothetical protein ACF8XB_08010, partial [Planctomycetota bacterium JB042]